MHCKSCVVGGGGKRIILWQFFLLDTVKRLGSLKKKERLIILYVADLGNYYSCQDSLGETMTR